MIKVGIIGAGGRMGTALMQHLEGVTDIEVTATLEQGDDVALLIQARPDVVVDLSNGPAVDLHGPAISQAAIPYVIGATGISPETIEAMKQDASQAPVLLVPNFSIGANLMIRFSALAARLMDDPVVTERHHKGKLDAPSGTALHTARAIADARGDRESGIVSPNIEVPGVLGGDAEGVRIHSVRGDGYLAEQQVMLCLPGESLEITHRSLDRKCFMPGIVLAIRNISKLNGFHVGLDALMEL